MSLLTSRRLAIGAVLFGLFIIFDIALFGWLIFNSLSQREIEEVLLETRNEAEALARKLEDGAQSFDQDLYVTVTVLQPTPSLESFPTQQKKMIRRLVIRNRDGTVVYQEESPNLSPELSLPGVELGETDSLEIPGRPPKLELEEVEVPIGELGTIVIGVSKQELQKSIEVLRRDLVQLASLIGLLTLLLLIVAFASMWMLFKRSRRLEEQAVEAERLAYIGTLASGLAHEIRNPLNSLSLNMQMLEEEVEQQQARGTQKRLLSITRSELRRLERLATDFLSYAKPRPLELEVTPAIELLEQVSEVMSGEIQERKATVEITDHSGGAQVRVDRGQINQLLINLTQNALAAIEKTEDGRVALEVRRRGDRVDLAVSDNGSGIPKEDQKKMFDLFFSTRKGGTGLGLAIVKRIATAHDAAIGVNSSPGEGTTITLTLTSVDSTESLPHGATNGAARGLSSEPKAPDQAVVMASNSSSVENSSGSSAPQAVQNASVTLSSSHSKV